MKEKVKLEIEGVGSIKGSGDLSTLKEGKSFTLSLSPKEGIIFQLHLLLPTLIGDKYKPQREYIEEVTEFINTNIEDIAFRNNGNDIDFSTKEGSKEEESDIINQFTLYVKNPLFGFAASKLHGKEKEFAARVIEAEERAKEAEKRAKKAEAKLKKLEGKEKLHKQPRNYLKTTAKLVGRSTNETTLFSLPTVIPEVRGNLFKEIISRNTAILGNYLLQLWQENGKGTLVIDNLSPIAEIMGNNNYEIKIYLLYLGGYVYPMIDKDDDGLTLTTEQLFKVKFRYTHEVRDKYNAGDLTAIGSSLSEFIKDEPIESIEITPNPLFIKAIEGKGLGNVLVANDKFVKIALSLTEIAYKIFSYSASNKPIQKITEDKLVIQLGLEVQIKKQGRPRIRATILKGLQELKDKGHIKSYSYNEDKGLYEFIYCEKYIKHPELKKSKNLNL
jgi:hypothetical protein